MQHHHLPSQWPSVPSGNSHRAPTADWPQRWRGMRVGPSGAPSLTGERGGRPLLGDTARGGRREGEEGKEITAITAVWLTGKQCNKLGYVRRPLPPVGWACSIVPPLGEERKGKERKTKEPWRRRKMRKWAMKRIKGQQSRDQETNAPPGHPA